MFTVQLDHHDRHSIGIDEEPLANCLRATSFDEGALTAGYGRYRLSSALQPIYSLAHQRAVGFEALVRARDHKGVNVAPPDLFRAARPGTERVALDRLCRTLHVGNFNALGLRSWLFLNISADVAVQPHRPGNLFFADLLRHYGLPAHQIVIEILESEIANERDLEAACQHYRDMGCLIALDDFGAGHSNFQRIWRCRPDIVKLDRQMIQECSESAVVRRSLPSLTGLLHEAGCMVAAEGVETEEQAVMLLDSNIDLAQGYLFARPFPINDPSPACISLLQSIHSRFVIEGLVSDAQKNDAFSPYLAAVERFAASVLDDCDIAEAARPLLSMDRVMRLFILNHQGDQTVHYFQTALAQNSRDPRLLPLTSAPGSAWYHRPYYRRAIAHPGTVQVTRAYLSLPDAGLCQTVSLCLERNGQRQVICLDISAEAA